MPANQFLANPANFRLHPRFQQDVTEGSLDDLGWIRGVLINRTTGRVIDGHLRVTLALRRGDDTPIPYDEVELTEAEEHLALAVLDASAGYATIDAAQLDALLREVSTGNEALQQMLAELANSASGAIPDIEFKEYDESVADEVTYCICPNCGHKFPQ